MKRESESGHLVPPDSLDAPGNALSSGEQSIRIAAIKTMERLGDRRSIKLLVESLKDENYEVRESAYAALRKLGQSTLPDLLPALKNDNFYVRMYSALAITDLVVQRPGGNYDEEVVDALTHALLDKSIYVRRSAYEALQVIEYNKIFKSLVSALGDKDQGIRLEAIIALGKLADRRAAKPLIKQLSSSDPATRRCAASALGRIKDKKATAPLTALLHDADGSVRKEAVKALGAMGDEKAVSGLLGALKDEEPSVREQAREALGSFQCFKRAAPFVDAIKDGDAAVRRAAVAALGRARGVKAVDYLICALADCDESVRAEAQMALARLGTKASGRLRMALNDDSDLVKSGAERALELMSKAKAKKRAELSCKLRSPEVWQEVEAAISAYSKERQASLKSFDI